MGEGREGIRRLRKRGRGGKEREGKNVKGNQLIMPWDFFAR